jgi:hypothetical protein
MATIKKMFQSKGSMRVAVKGSTAVKEMLYNGTSETLYVTFNSGTQYKIAGVTRDQFKYGRSAPSIGHWVNGLIQRQGATKVVTASAAKTSKKSSRKVAR